MDLIVGEERAAEMKATSKDFASLTLEERPLCDLELLAVGGFSPLSTFMNKADYERVVGESRLADGTLWPLPVVLPVKPGDGIGEGKPLALRDVYGNLLAFLHVEEIYDLRQGQRSAECLWVGRCQASVGRVSEPAAGPLCFGQARGDPGAAALRFCVTAADAGGTARALSIAGLEQDRRVPDAQPAAPGTRRADQEGGPADRRWPVDPPGGRRNEAGRRGPFHPGAMLSSTCGQLL